MNVIRHAEMVEVTPKEWVDFLIKFNCHGTEFNSNTLDHVDNKTGTHLGQVVYLDFPMNKYFINKNAVSLISCQK